MNLITYNLCDDWGWYIDTDNTLLINSNNFDLNIPNRPYKMMNYHYNRLYTIDENDDYLKKKYKDIENLEIDSSYKKIDKKQIVKRLNMTFAEFKKMQQESKNKTSL